ncbi:MAG TPA: hypothetical protein VLJ57_05470 [Burkholderiaceae bacterium]|nr:hypothetical protein [Burkholderiaceae bacterium]
MISPPRTRPSFVPTLTEVVPASAVPAPVLQAGEEALQEQLIHGVMQRVDVMLQRQLNEAVAKVVLEHTRALAPRLREEIEFVVRQAVTDAIAHELTARKSAA